MIYDLAQLNLLGSTSGATIDNSLYSIYINEKERWTPKEADLIALYVAATGTTEADAKTYVNKIFKNQYGTMIPRQYNSYPVLFCFCKDKSKVTSTLLSAVNASIHQALNISEDAIPVIETGYRYTLNEGNSIIPVKSSNKATLPVPYVEIKKPATTSTRAEILLTETEKTITPPTNYDGLDEVIVTHAPVEASHTATITENGTHTITPSEGFDAMIQATITVNVPQDIADVSINQNIDDLAVDTVISFTVNTSSEMSVLAISGQIGTTAGRSYNLDTTFVKEVGFTSDYVVITEPSSNSKYWLAKTGTDTTSTQATLTIIQELNIS